MYAKFARFICLGLVTEPAPGDFVNTLVQPAGGILATPQNINDGHVGEFIVDRARQLSQSIKLKMSNKQQKVIQETQLADAARLLNSDLFKALIADYLTPTDPAGLLKPEENGGLCPCGSGKVHGDCHGRSI